MQPISLPTRSSAEELGQRNPHERPGGVDDDLGVSLFAGHVHHLLDRQRYGRVGRVEGETSGALVKAKMLVVPFGCVVMRTLTPPRESSPASTIGPLSRSTFSTA